jgi:adenylate cyclase
VKPVNHTGGPADCQQGGQTADKALLSPFTERRQRFAHQVDEEQGMTEPTAMPDVNTGVRRLLLRGVFWRILIIEAVLLVWSLGYRYVTDGPPPTELFWYAVRIVLLVSIILVFMLVTLRSFLSRNIIQPLESISRANRQFLQGSSQVRDVALPANTPREITEIVQTRNQMLDTILKESHERLQLVTFIRETFGRYVSDKVVDQILESPSGQKIGGRRETVTILITDLRGFTALSETMDPEALMGLLNRYLERMSEVILGYDGLIDEIMGDSILTVFGVPESRPDDAARAVACGLEMQQVLAALNRETAAEGLPQIEMGVGINTGTVIVGNIGSEKRLKYGIMGSAVNVAARIESNTIGGQVLIGESTHRLVEKLVTAQPPQSVMMKGLRRPLVYYPVTAIGPPYDLRVEPTGQSGVEIPITLAFTYWKVGDKKVEDTALAGETLSLGPGTIAARVDGKLETLTNVKLRFDFCVDSHCFSDVYAKVIAGNSDRDGDICQMHITSINSQDRRILDRWLSEAR